MFAGLLFSYRVCLFWLLIVSRVISDETSAYYENLAREESRTTRYQNDPSFNGVFRRNGAWLPRIKSMESSHTDKEIMRRERERRRQNIYDGTEYDWDNSFPAMEETPTWPPDFNAWPETPTQPPTQVVSQVQQMIPTQVPIQAQYQVPASATPQNGPLYNPPRGVPNTLPQTPIHSGIHSGTWRSPLKVPQSTRPLRLRAGGLDVRNASRVCSPGPPLGVNPLFRNCLIIGDSISLGYLTAVKSQLQGLCQVQHAPFAKASGAVDSRYGLKCLPLILSTTALEPTKYDAIVFNFGMHDIDYSKVFPEEFVPLEEYSDNLLKIKDFLLLTGAQVAFALTTPVPMAGRRHRRVVKYNTEARRVMQRDSRVEIVDLYTAVTHICGEPPYNSCSIMKRPKDVHFNPKGNRVLGVLVATTLKRLLSKAKPRGRFSAPKAPELSAREGLASSYFHDDTLYCPDMVTRCPIRATCSEDLLSLTGYGCCMEANAVICADSWHCCPRGSHCSPDCNFRSCKCLFKSSSPASSNVSNVVKTKEVTMKKLNSKSSTGSKFAEEKLTNAEKPGKLVKAAEHKIVSMKHKVGIGGKNGKKNEKENRKHRKMEKMAGNKSRKDQNEKKHRHLHYKTKNKKHSNHMKSQKEKFHDKIDQKHKTKTAKVTKPLSWEETKTEPSLSKHLIKENPTHRRTNYHPSTKQYWVTRINKGLGLTTKRKPSIKFAHALGKGKHQNVSYRSNGKQKTKPGKSISMKEELKNLIVKYRQDLQAKLKLHSAKTPCGFKGLGMKRQRGKASIRNLHVANNKRYHRLQRRKKLSRTGTRLKPRRKLKHIDGGRRLKSALSTNIVQNHNFTSKEGIVQEMRPENKTTNNLKSFERGTDKIVTDSDFSGSRQTIRVKELAKGDISHSKIIFSERTIANNITDKNTVRKLRIKTNIKTSEKQLVMGSNGTSQRALPEQNNSPRSNNEKGDELCPSSNLHQSNDDFEKNYSAVGSTSQEDQGRSISGAVLVPSDNERADRVTRHPIKNVGSASGLVPLSSLMGEYGGDSGAGSSAEFKDEEESLPVSSDGPEAMFPKTRTSWNRAGRDETGKLEREGIETDGDTSGSGVAQTKRILDESRDAGFVTLSPEMESPRSGPQNLVEQTITGDLFSGSGFHTEPVGDSPPQLSISSQYRDANNVQPSTRRLPMDYNLNVYQNRAERKIDPTPGSHSNSSLSTEGESESGDHGYYDSRNVINFQKHSKEEGSQDSTIPFDQISASKELGSAEGFSTFSSADYGQDLSSSGSGPGKVLVVDTSGVERETTSYGSGLHFGGENDNDKQRASKREDFPFGDSLLCVISPNCKT